MSDPISTSSSSGGGPAGLSAALVLGRCCRKVLVVDAGNPRNIRSHGVHGFITREGCRPAELLAMARDQIKPYGVQFRDGTVMKVDRNERVSCHTTGWISAECRKILLATGVVDKLPALDGIERSTARAFIIARIATDGNIATARIAVYGSRRERHRTGPPDEDMDA